jgi:hypothetical protein
MYAKRPKQEIITLVPPPAGLQHSTYLATSVCTNMAYKITTYALLTAKLTRVQFFTSVYTLMYSYITRMGKVSITNLTLKMSLQNACVD